ncbi:LAGLIDADG family homing endonuclease [Patescibacteria group bacterium]|nr:LAGLIDADG family homing endonuclease [Patescibacteria group bacterium]
MPAVPFQINKTDLVSLYFQQKLSMFQIADHYGCTHGTIVDRFKQFNLKSRGNLGLRKPIKISREKLELLYNKPLSAKQIGQKLGFSKSGIEKRLKQFQINTRGNLHKTHRKYKKFPFNGSSEEKAYLIGFRLGDLNVYHTNQVVVIRGSTTKPAQAKLIKRLFKSYGGVQTTIAKRGTIEQCVYLNRSFDFLLPKHDKIEQWIKNCPRCFLSFFAGYFDAEGCVTIHKNSRDNFAGFEIQTYDKHIILQSWQCLRKLGINAPKPRISQHAGYIDLRQVIHNQDSWRLSVFDKNSVWKLLYWFDCLLKHEDKRKKFIEVRKNILNRNKMRRGGKVIDLKNISLPQHNH